MARKQRPNKNRKGKRSNNKRKPTKKPLNRAEHKAVKKMIDRALDSRIEDKFLLDDDWVNQVHMYSGANHPNDPSTLDPFPGDYATLSDLTPAISQGDGQNQMNGLAVTLKSGRVQIRYVPQSTFRTCQQEQPPHSQGDLTENINMFMQVPDVECLLVMVPKEYQGTTSQPYVLRDAIMMKFKPPGFYNQDLYTNLPISAAPLVAARKMQKGLKLLGRCRLKTKFRTQVTRRDSYTDADGNHHKQCNFYASIGQQDNAVIKFNIDKKVDIINADPVKFNIILMCSWNSKWHNHSYNSFGAPYILDTRVLYNYEDA